MLKRLTDTVVVKRKSPVNLVFEHELYFCKEFERETAASYLYAFENVSVTNEASVYKNFRLVKEVGGIQINSWRYKLSVFLKRKMLRLPTTGLYLFACDAWSGGYFHWMGDVLPRLMAVNDLCQNYTLILPSYPTSFQLESLRIFKFKSVFIIPPNKNIFVPRLIIPAPIAISGNYNEDLMRRIRNEYRHHYKDKINLDIGDKIYISRNKATKRKVSNEADLIPILDNYGFKVIYTEDYTFEEQIGLFYNCKYLISIHGAGLINMLFMSGKSYVMEFRKELDDSNLCYFSLASALDLYYFYQFGHIATQDNDTNTADIEIDHTLFEQNIQQMLAYKK